MLYVKVLLAQRGAEAALTNREGGGGQGQGAWYGYFPNRDCMPRHGSTHGPNRTDYMKLVLDKALCAQLLVRWAWSDRQLRSAMLRHGVRLHEDYVGECASALMLTLAAMSSVGESQRSALFQSCTP